MAEPLCSREIKQLSMCEGLQLAGVVVGGLAEPWCASGINKHHPVSS